MFKRRTIVKPWDGSIEPFKIVENVYFIGTFQASSHLIDTGDGLIVIDTGYLPSLYLVVNSIYKLGFKPTDIKYILNSHWHLDHTEATAALAQLSGARTYIGRKDADKAEAFFTPDALIDDGDIITLGNTSIRCMETPGHTAGTISFFFDSAGERKYRCGMFGGAGANTLAAGQFDYDGCREGYLVSLDRLRGERVEVFLGNHVWNNNTEEKAEILRRTGENKFIDSDIWGEFLDFCGKRLKEIVEAENNKA